MLGRMLLDIPKLRDSDINKYSRTLNKLTEEGYLIIRLGSSGRELVRKPRFNFIDLTYSKISVTEQMLIMSELEFIIGTGSGISQWWHLFNIPIMFLNSAALPNSPFTTNCVHACKRIEKTSKQFRSNSDNLLLLLKSTWNWINPRDCEIRELTADEIYTEVENYKIDYLNQKCWRSTHSLLAELGLDKKEIPDYYLTESTYRHLHGIFKS